jgi:hypothetical protein
VNLARIARIVLMALAGLVLLCAFVFRNEVLRSSLDPKTPFQTYQPPPAPDYRQAAAWALLGAGQGPVDVFFIHPTTYSGGEEWNGPIHHPRASRELARVMLPNYAGPFARLGRLFAPRYRQASLYAGLSLREDAQEARRFAYGDVRAAFERYLASYNHGRPLIVVGVEQGGALAALLLREEFARDPSLKARLAAAYLIQTITPRDEHGPGAPLSACVSRQQASCLVAYMAAPTDRPSVGQRMLARALVWSPGGELEPLDGRAPACVNPLTGKASDALAPERLNRGAANATELEWGLRPAFLPRQVSAQCRQGLLMVSKPRSTSLRAVGGWADRQKAAPFNLFYADLEADARERIRALDQPASSARPFSRQAFMPPSRAADLR